MRHWWWGEIGHARWELRGWSWSREPRPRRVGADFFETQDAEVLKATLTPSIMCVCTCPASRFQAGHRGICLPGSPSQQGVEVELHRQVSLCQQCHWLLFIFGKGLSGGGLPFLFEKKNKNREGHRLRPTPAWVTEWIAPGVPLGQAAAPTGPGLRPWAAGLQRAAPGGGWNASLLSILSVMERKIPAK